MHDMQSQSKEGASSRIAHGAAAEEAAVDLRPVQGPDADAELSVLSKALGNPTRVQILRLLIRSRTCVCGQIVEALPLAQSTVSQHLKVLKDAGLIRAESDGARTCYYAEPGAVRRLKALLASL